MLNDTAAFSLELTACRGARKLPVPGCRGGDEEFVGPRRYLFIQPRIKLQRVENRTSSSCILTMTGVEALFQLATESECNVHGV